MNSTILFIFYLFLSISYSQNQINQEGQSFIRVSSSIPSSFDWRQSGQMTPVKDQKDCNAYYAFSTIAFFQQDLIINQGASSDIDLSQQFLAKCLPTGGCIGGSPKDAMQLVLKKGGIPKQSKYPYIPYDNTQSDICYPSQLVKVGDRPMFSFYDINNQQFLKQLILKQPLNIYICSADLKLYGPTSNTDRTLKCGAGNFNNDHTVLLVGYTETQWIIKNSWGSGWGINGYAYISRNSDNDCCIGSQVYLRGAKTNTSTCKIQNCQSCVQQNYCSKCKPGYYVATKDSKHSCVQCTLANCAQCQNSVGYCRTCIYGYALYFPDKICKQSVIQNCKNIVNGGCKDCHNGYKVTAQFTCVRQCTITNCQTCKDDKSCSQCVIGYELVVENKKLICKENICKTENCAACSQLGKCIQCKGSYSLIEDSCVMVCDKKDCQKCSEVKNQCQKCNQGYALDFYSHQCVSTSVKNCLQSYLTKYCSICSQGYQRSDSWQQCNKICNVLNCKSCQVGRSNQCITCETGYKLLTPQNQTIPICEKNKCDFPNCTLCDFGSASCYQCVDKYHRWSASQKACVPFTCPLQNCNKCTTDAQKCEQCKSGTIKFISTGGCILSSIQNCDAIGMNKNTSQLQCWDCKTGYEVDYKTWKSCKLICIDVNCIDCSDNAKICKTCLSGYGLKNISLTNQTRCVKIAVYLPNCLRGNSQQTFCYQCKQFYFFNNKTLNCQPNTGCPTNCIKCSAPGQDLKCQCKTGMVWDFINKQCVKNPTDSNCLVIANYSGNQQCFQCKDRYTLTDDGKGCISNCAVSNCDQCVRSISQNYPDYCSKCIGGYVNTPNMTKCVTCQVENCQTCKSYDARKVCLTCKLGYQLKGDGTCKQIQCQQHAVFNGLQCACQNSYYKDPANQQCKKCGNACKRCTKQDNCIQCSQGFFLESDKCTACLQNCQKCQNATTCKLCQQGFTYQEKNQTFSCIETGLGNEGFKLQGGKKVRCLAGCGSCLKDYRICQQCLDGYILLEDKCQKCEDNCKTCYNNILSACILCEIGSVLNSQGKCVRCSSQNCLSCPTTANICVQCIQGYYLKDQKCKSCGLGCKTCDKNGTCTQAESGFALVEGVCEQCLDGCSECQPKSLQKCDDGCLEGNYISIQNICTPCPQVCRTCQSQKNCTKCITGYNLVSGTCTKSCNDTNCFDCSVSSNSCKQCFAGYKLDKDFKCIQDLDCNNIIPQQNVNETGSCKVCPHRYFLQNGICQQCEVFDTNCVGCTVDSPTNCTQCAKKYYLDIGMCNKCSQNCQTCRNKDYCYMCSFGYYMLEKDKEYSGICLKCDSNCLTCVDEPTKCLSCQKGYKLSVAKICMNSDSILYVIRLRLNFLFYSVNIGKFRRAFHQLFNQKGGYHFQIQKATSGSTILQGYISINPQTQSTQNMTTFKKLSNKIRARQSIAGIQVESVSLSYKGQRYSSDGSNDINVNLNKAVEGWVIAVAVVGSVIGLVVLICLVVYIKKKQKQTKIKRKMMMLSLIQMLKIHNPTLKRIIQNFKNDFYYVFELLKNDYLFIFLILYFFLSNELIKFIYFLTKYHNRQNQQNNHPQAAIFYDPLQIEQTYLTIF